MSKRRGGVRVSLRLHVDSSRSDGRGGRSISRRCQEGDMELNVSLVCCKITREREIQQRSAVVHHGLGLQPDS